MRKKALKISMIASAALGGWFLFYLILLPKMITSDFVINKVQNLVKTSTGFALTLENPSFETKFKPEIELKIGKINLTKDEKILALIEDFELELGFGKIFKKEIRLDELSAKKVFIDGKNILTVLPSNLETSQNTDIDWKVNLDNAEFEVDEGLITYNKSKVTLSTQASAQNLEVKAVSDNFLVSDIFELVNSNLIIPNGKEMLSPLTQPNGAVSFNISLRNNGISGNVNMKYAKAVLKDLSNLPLTMPKGQITIMPEKMVFSNFEGFYGKNKSNKINISGEIKDYYKSFDSNITVDTVATNEFLQDYLAGLMGGTVIKISENIPTRIIYKAIDNKSDIIWLTKIAKGVSFGVDDTPSPLNEYDRAVKGDFHIEGSTLDIKNINYYIAQDIYKGMGKIDPILVFDGKMDILSGKLHEAGFSFGRELPSEFLNVIVRQKLFKKGTIKGNLHVVFKNDIPKIQGDLEIAKTRIPSQRLFIKNATLKTDNNNINLNANGRFKRIKYDFIGVIKNELVTPIIVKDLELNLDKVNLDKLLTSLNNQSQVEQPVAEITTTEIDDEECGGEDDNFMFDTNLISIENCIFRLKEGNYKDVQFGNIEAKMTLDKDGIFNLQSNKFDIAEGISTLKINCDLKTLKYYLRLGLKEVNSDLMSTAILGLSKEISGKASGLIELNSDASMKLNGSIRFLIHDGTIGKIGVVEYLMKVASIFRNPVVMISPTTLLDIVNIPEGNFDKIEGEITLKDNVIKRMDIKSSSPTLSALIRGRYDLENQDASLRIYTRFSNENKGFLGKMRNISLNALANKVKLSSRNDANYYAAELVDLPPIQAKDEYTQVFLTQVEGDVEHNNFLSSLKKIK